MSAESAVKFTWRYPLWHSHEGYALKSGQIVVNERIVQTYPDNDGGCWYYDPETGKKVVRE
jgi:hypothetical protein